MAATPTPPRPTPQNVARQAGRANPGSLGGRRTGLAPVRSEQATGSPASGAGNQEFFVESYDEDVSFARGYVHATFDPAGDFPAP